MKDLEDVTFNEICEEWLAFKKNRVKESTFLNYKFIILRRLERDFWKKKLTYIKDYNFNLYVDILRNSLAPKTVKDTFSVLKSVLQYMERKYDLDLKLDLISAPVYYKKEVKLFTERERKKIEKFALSSQNPREIGILICLYTGMRIGEICALKWSDIDFDAKLINVVHTVQRVYLIGEKSKVTITTPKTRNSIRKIPIAKCIYPVLKEFSKNFHKDAYILTGERNKPLEPLSYRYHFKHVLKNLKIKYKHFHCLRHTFATKCMQVGMDAKSLSEILGHSSVSITLSIYVHSSYNVKRKYIDKL